jgi:hypothetical protein
MGGMVMLIVLAVLLPIIQLNQWVKSTACAARDGAARRGGRSGD